VSGIFEILAQVGNLGSEFIVGDNFFLVCRIGSRFRFRFGVGESRSSSRKIFVDRSNCGFEFGVFTLELGEILDSGEFDQFEPYSGSPGSELRYSHSG